MNNIILDFEEREKEREKYRFDDPRIYIEIWRRRRRRWRRTEENSKRAGKSLKEKRKRRREKNGYGDGPAGEPDGNKGGEQVAPRYVPFFSPPSNKTFRSFHSLLSIPPPPRVVTAPALARSRLGLASRLELRKKFKILYSSFVDSSINRRPLEESKSRKAAIEHSREISEARLYETIPFLSLILSVKFIMADHTFPPVFFFLFFPFPFIK